MRHHNVGLVRPVILALALLVPLAGIAGGHALIPDLDWKALHQDPPHLNEIDVAAQQGFAACRATLADTLMHATGARERQSLVNTATPAADSRPASVLSVVASSAAGASEGHAQTTVGVDASGGCFALWSDTRFWEMTCRSLRDRFERYEDYRKLEEMLDGSVRLKSDHSGIDIIMTDLGRNCLVTEREIYYYEDANPDFSVPADEP